MSKIVIDKKYPKYVQLWFTDDEQIGTFWTLHCEKHGDGLSFTDKSGADNCIKCIEDMINNPTNEEVKT